MLNVLRGLFVAVCGLMGWQIGIQAYAAPVWQGMAIGIGIGLCCVLLELAFARRFISIISVVMFGVVFGFIISNLVLRAIALVPAYHPTPTMEIGLTFVFSFLSILSILHAKDDFKFVIPFVELKREGGPGGRPVILDTSAIIDGRVADLIDLRLFDGPIVLPRFVLQELQTVADSQDRLKRNRGRRGLDILNRIRSDHGSRVVIQEATLPDTEGVDAKLVRLAKLIEARLLTLDFNLNKVAQVQGVEVINLNEIANALRPPLIQGERLSVRVVKAGESAGQGVGYLEDGTMVVAEDCASRVGQDVDLVVTNVLQTSAGRMIFGRPAPGEEPAPAPRLRS
ncbi:MAG TPA: PIN domain-containing protein [Planctomycetota bacterium]|jgi:uncharacterized protein YacL